MKRLIIALSLLLSPGFFAAAQSVNTCRVTASEIYSGYVTQKVWLNHYALPKVTLSGIEYTSVNAVPHDALPSSTTKPHVVLGKERKRPFALISVPAYTYKDGKLQQVTQFTTHVEEAGAEPSHAVAKTTASASPLANGSWYKISVSATGLYRVDYDFSY